MEYKVGSLSEYVLSELATTGEIVYDRFLESVPYDKKYVWKVIKELTDKGLVRRFTYKDRDDKLKTLRLRCPKGQDAVKEISDELLLHFEFLEGEKSNAYKGSKGYRQRKLSRAILLSAFEENGYFTIDFLSQSYEVGKGSGNQKKDETASEGASIFDEKGSPKGIREILKEVDSSAPHFFVSKAILKEIHKEAAGYAEGAPGRGSVKRKPAASSRALGVIVKDERYALCYYFDAASTYWNRKVEIATSMYLKSYQQSFQPDVSPRTECFIYTKSPDEIAGLLRDKKSRRAIDPISVFDTVYALPFSENHADLTRVILEPGIYGELNKRLLGDQYSPGKNGRLGYLEGRPVYSVLDSELCYIKDLTEVIEDDALVIAHEWQEEIVEEFFPKSCGMMALNREDFRVWIPEEGGEGD